jgi:hypothetical protein
MFKQLIKLVSWLFEGLGKFRILFDQDRLFVFQGHKLTFFSFYNVLEVSDLFLVGFLFFLALLTLFVLVCRQGNRGSASLGITLIVRMKSWLRRGLFWDWSTGTSWLRLLQFFFELNQLKFESDIFFDKGRILFTEVFALFLFLIIFILQFFIHPFHLLPLFFLVLVSYDMDAGIKLTYVCCIFWLSTDLWEFGQNHVPRFVVLFV